jgi:hypothetical protein
VQQDFYIILPMHFDAEMAKTLPQFLERNENFVAV